MTNEEYLAYIISALNTRYEVNIQLALKNGIVPLLPSVHKNRNCSNLEISYNPSIVCCFYLCENNDPNILFGYLIAHKYALYNRYAQCKEWINRCNRNISRRIFKGLFSKKKYNELQLEYKFYELIFVLLHEYSHALFYLKPDFKNSYLCRVKSKLLELTQIKNEADIVDAIVTEIPWFFRPFIAKQFDLGQIERTKESFYKLIDNPSRLEEMSCDLHACELIQLMIENSQFHDIEMCQIYKHCVDSLYYVEFLNTVDECITGKIDMKTAEDKSFFDSTRYSVLTQHITTILEHRAKGLGLLFDSYPIVNKSTIKLYGKMMKDYIPKITDLMEGSLFPIDKDKEVCTNLMQSLEKSIIDNYIH